MRWARPARLPGAPRPATRCRRPVAGSLLGHRQLQDGCAAVVGQQLGVVVRTAHLVDVGKCRHRLGHRRQRRSAGARAQVDLVGDDEGDRLGGRSGEGAVEQGLGRGAVGAGQDEGVQRRGWQRTVGEPDATEQRQPQHEHQHAVLGAPAPECVQRPGHAEVSPPSAGEPRGAPALPQDRVGSERIAFPETRHDPVLGPATPTRSGGRVPRGSMAAHEQYDTHFWRGTPPVGT